MPDESARELHASEIAKNEAEAEKFRAEAEVTRAKGEAEARKARAEAAVAETEAEADRLRLVDLEFTAERAREKRAEELAANKYHHTYLFDTDVDENNVKKFIAQLATWERTSSEPITVELVINSPGGSVVDGFALIDYIAAMAANGHTVNTTAYGMAASMGGVLLQVGARRTMGANSVLLIHEAQFGAVGSYGEIEDRVKLVNILHERILNLFADRAKVSKSYIKRNWNRRDWWLDASTALKHGFVDEVR
jgi:ATP-dependent Clp protease, protease subunit